MLTMAQFQAINRLLESLDQRDSVRRIHIAGMDNFVRVTFDAGWGQLSFDIDEEGNSAQVNFGSSEISD